MDDIRSLLLRPDFKNCAIKKYKRGGVEYIRRIGWMRFAIKLDRVGHPNFASSIHRFCISAADGESNLPQNSSQTNRVPPITNPGQCHVLNDSIILLVLKKS